MLAPKKLKHRKVQKNRKNKSKERHERRGSSLAFGAYGLKAMTGARIRSQQIEAARRVISRTMGKTGKVWIRIFPGTPYTQKAAEVGMGKGKGDPQGFEAEVLPGRIVFELEHEKADICREALRKASMKLPIKTKIISRV